MSKNEDATFPRRFPGVREMSDMQRLAHRQIAGFDIYHHIMAANWPVFSFYWRQLMSHSILLLDFFISLCLEALPMRGAAQLPTHSSSACIPWLGKATATYTRRRSMRICL